MPALLEDDEIPLPLVRRRADSEELDTTDEADEPLPMDRMGIGTSGGLAGFFAGAAGLAVVHAMLPLAVLGPVHNAARQWVVDPMVSLGVAYVTASAIGSLIGACFAGVTRYLRRWFPLVIWALVFFVSLTLLVLALAKRPALAPAVLAASAAYAFVVSFSLPLRKRG
jgi:hypothetical protein